LRGGEDAILQNEPKRVGRVVGGKAARGGRWKKFLTQTPIFILQVHFFKRLIQWGKNGVLWYFRHGDLRFASRNFGVESARKIIGEVGGMERWRGMVFHVQSNAME
jgi:hypothetical protein